MKKEIEWFESWFDSPYYHILYKNRDKSEATLFIKKLLNFLKPHLNSKFIDLACGKGRHAITINELGFEVIGIDISKNSINEAKIYENETLKFDVADIRLAYKTNYFNFALSLFTSFGYFGLKDDVKVINAAYESLKPNGIYVIDFLNFKNVLHPEFTKTVNQIDFKINKTFDNEKIIKTIEVNDQGKMYNFKEEVYLYNIQQLESMLTQNGFKLLDVFGDYHLNSYVPSQSDRIILIACKS